MNDQPAPVGPMSDDEIRREIGEIVGYDIYWCTCVWEAWSYGTMTQDDFVLGSECDDLINNILELVRTAATRGVAPVEHAPAGTLPVHTGSWQADDVARDGDNDDPKACWVYAPRFTRDVRPWRPLVTDPDLDPDDEWFGRDDLPKNLALIVRSGRPATH